MREQLVKYVQLLFAGTPDSEDMQQEILQNTLDKYDDLIAQGKTPEAAYRLAIGGIGDVQEILGGAQESSAPVTVTVIKNESEPSRKKWMRAVAIGLYICCVIPIIALGNIGNGIIGVCLMFLMIAAATVLIIVASSGHASNKEYKDVYAAKHPIYRAYKSISGVLALGIYLVISFATQAWYITWLVFPISAAVDGIVKAIFDLKEASKRET